MGRWLTPAPFAPALVLAAMAWGAALVAFLLMGPGLGAWADTLLTACFGWSAETRRYRLDGLLLALLQPPLFVGVVAVFFADELRVFLEEAAGVSKYRERRRETELRIGDTRDNLQRVNDIREELGKQLERLQEQAEVAAKYRELQQALANTHQLLWLVRKQEAQAQGNRLARDLERVAVEIEAENARLADAQKRGEALRVEFYAASDRVSAAQGEFFQAGSEVARLEQQLGFLRDSRARVEAQLAQLDSDLQQCDAQRSQASATVTPPNGKNGTRRRKQV